MKTFLVIHPLYSEIKHDKTKAFYKENFDITTTITTDISNDNNVNKCLK